MAITTRMLCMYNSITMYIYNDVMKHTIDQLLIQSIYLSMGINLLYMWICTYIIYASNYGLYLTLRCLTYCTNNNNKLCQPGQGFDFFVISI